MILLAQGEWSHGPTVGRSEYPALKPPYMGINNLKYLLRNEKWRIEDTSRYHVEHGGVQMSVKVVAV